VDKITVLIIDEQTFFRTGLRQALSQQSDFEILDCDPAQDPLGIIEADLPDVVLLGSDLAALSSLELGKKIAQHYPNTKVIMLSPNPSDEELFQIIKTAAVACLNKNTAAEELGSTVRRAYRGEYPINDSLVARPVVARHVLKQFQEIASMGKTIERISAPLTHRETQILSHVANGNTNKEIAHLLGISEQTIKSHVSAVLRKINANDRAHAVALAMRNGWISIEREHESMVAV
jgi:DNA-binding NarL/FixJ family response regulator